MASTIIGICILQTDIIKLRKVYDAFLAEFPLCFGYWKKYADHEARLDGVEKTVEVYERAVLAVTYSVEIWGNYCQFAISTYDDPDIVRRWFNQFPLFLISQDKMVLLFQKIDSLISFHMQGQHEGSVDETDYNIKLVLPLFSLLNVD